MSPAPPSPRCQNHIPCCAARKEKRGCKSSQRFFGVKTIEGAFGRGDGPRLPWAAAGCLPTLALAPQPVCLSHGRRELPGAARAVRKAGGRTGGLWAGNREHGSSWEMLRGPGQGGSRAGEGQQLGPGGAGRPQPPGSAHSWRKRHFWGQLKAWEKFQGCLWSTAAAKPLGPGATAVAPGSGGSVRWLLLLWGSGRQRSDLQGCQAPGQLLGTGRGDGVGPAPVWSTGAACLGTPRLAPRASVSPSAELPPSRLWLAVLPEGSAGGKRRFPSLAYDCTWGEVESRPLRDLPAGHVPLVTVSLPESRPRPPPCSEQLHGLGAAPCPTAAQFPTSGA